MPKGSFSSVATPLRIEEPASLPLKLRFGYNKILTEESVHGFDVSIPIASIVRKAHKWREPSSHGYACASLGAQRNRLTFSSRRRVVFVRLYPDRSRISPTIATFATLVAKWRLA